MRLTDEPAMTIRTIIGDARADELGRMAAGMCAREPFSVEEIKYLAECVDWIACFKSEYDAMQAEEGAS